MTHYPAAVLVPQNVVGQGKEAIEDFIEEVVDPYSEHNRTEEPWKRYISEEREKGWFRYMFRVPEGDREALWDAMQEGGCGYDAEIAAGDLGLDEGGFWEMTYSNPQGKWDYWSVCPYDEGLEGAVPVKDWPNGLILNRLISEGEGWVEWGRPGWFGAWEELMPRDEWVAKWNSLLEQHPDHCIVTLDCHT